MKCLLQAFAFVINFTIQAAQQPSKPIDIPKGKSPVKIYVLPKEAAAVSPGMPDHKKKRHVKYLAPLDQEYDAPFTPPTSPNPPPAPRNRDLPTLSWSVLIEKETMRLKLNMTPPEKKDK